MRRTVTTLADGRELLYFDHASVERTDKDARELPEPPPASELRYDPLLEEWVAVAAHRQGRTHLPPADECPLCPSTGGRTTEIPATDYDVVVFENRFPSFSHRVVRGEDAGGSEGGAEGGPGGEGGRPGGGDDLDLFRVRRGAGRCEVVCFTADHDVSFAGLTPDRVRLIVDAWADRTAELSGLPGVEQVFCFENRGEEIGVTLRHPHGQIYAYPFVTPRTGRMLAAARRHRERTGSDLFADVLAAERRARTRVVAENRDWTAFVPAAARWPFEVHLYPNRRVGTISELDAAARDGFGPIYLEVLRRLDGLFGVEMPYIAGWYQAPVTAERDLAYLHLRLFSNRRAPGKLKYLAGSESAMDVFINDVPPEEAARMLRAATPRPDGPV
jgi:UDPglucose--hexose-1-phosphate uridylyltransferase